jgi:hypothetical protein
MLSTPLPRLSSGFMSGQMIELRDFIKTRQAEIKELGTPLWERRAALQAELLALNEKIAKLTQEWEELEKAASAIGSKEGNAEIDQRKREEITIKEAVMKVLADHPQGLNSASIRHQINTRFFNGKVRRTSFSPQLSRLKTDKLISLVDGNYVSNIKNDEGSANAEPSFISPSKGSS